MPRPDHIVVIVEENHSQQSIIGNPAAPYITSLASSGANFTQFFAETHPSQPNYIAMFSGSTQGVTDDSCPQTFGGASVGSELLAAGVGFTGYSETQPSAGYTGCYNGKYARKHNPWSDFNNIPASSNQPFSAFPADYSTLPAVSFVIPNLDNDMHDGSIAQGDNWLQTNMSGYVSWAKAHNSVFVLTFDEDDGSEQNKIPTVITGAGVTQGSYAETVNHYNLLRTIEDAYGLAPLGASATASPILDIWTPTGGNQPPVAAFTASCSQLTCTFDATGSADPDGTIASYSWTFGDGTTGSGKTTAHSYAAGGDYSVQLTVTDDQSATATVSHSASPATSGAPFVADTYSRSVSGGLGTADTGGRWTVASGAANLSVNSGTATLALPKSATQDEAYVGPGQTDADLAATVAPDRVPTGGPLYVTTTARRVAAGTSYYSKAVLQTNATVVINVGRLVSGSDTALASRTVSGLSYSTGTQLQMRVQATGTNPTTVRARIWAVGTAEPTTWQVTASDSSAALQSAGAVGLTAYLSGAATNAPVNLRVTSFVAKPTTAPVNQPPTAAFSFACSQLTCTFDGSASSDIDGSVVSYAWGFGDGATGTGAHVTHAFVSAGNYSVVLTATDNSGATSTVNHAVTATAPPVNQPPTARFTSTCTQLSCQFDASTSSDPEDVTPNSYAWNFGDGTSATGVGPAHAYAAAGTYDVVLTVTDDDGASDAVTHSVVAANPANQPPTAAFTSSCSQLSCSVDATGSRDPDGSITSFSWNFGDGSTGTGVTTTHTYAVGGSDTVTLTVTDNSGAIGTASNTVTPTATANSPFAADAFGRTVRNGWGSADTGGAWSLVGSASRAAVNPGAATLLLDKASQVEGYLGGVSRTDADVTVSVSVDKRLTGGPVYVSVLPRRVASNTSYLAKSLWNADGSVTLSITRMVGGSETVLASVKVPGLTYVAGTVLRIRAQAVGVSPTTVRARIWDASAAEPASWQVATTDATAALQTAGAVGVIGYLSSAVTNGPVVISFGNVSGRPTAAA